MFEDCFESFVRTEYESDPYPLTGDHFKTAQLATWTDARVRLAQLLTQEHTATLILYYWQVQSILDVIEDEPAGYQSVEAAVAYAQSAIKYGDRALTHSAKYVDLQDMSYTESVDETFAQLEERIRPFREQYRSTDKG